MGTMSDTSTNTNSEFSVLYVDDEEMALKYFQRSVGRDFTVHTASDVEAGLSILAAHGDGIGVLITDQRMPGQSGVDLLKQVRLRWPHIVRLLTTAYADLDDAIEAVNRGEIFRYITKPWDLKALRAEINQAMEIFRLQREHDALMREKLSVWQRLIQLGRVRDLVIMGGSFTHLRHGENAVEAYLTDHLAPAERGDLASPAHLDLWGLTEREIDRTLAFVREVVDRTADSARRDERFDTDVDAQGLLRLGGEAFRAVEADGHAPKIRVAEAAAAVLLAELGALGGIDSVKAGAAAEGIALTLTLRGSADVPTRGGLTARKAAGLLTAYLMAYHHGGSLRRQARDAGQAYVLTLPADPARVSLDPPRQGWLESLLVRLEGWD